MSPLAEPQRPRLVKRAGMLATNQDDVLAAATWLPAHPSTDAAKAASETFWGAASAEFCRRLNLNAKTTPRPKVGQVDFHKVHCFALDRLFLLLERLLPDGKVLDDGECLAWRAIHPDTASPISVSLFTGSWQDAGAGVGGRDLIGLTAHVSNVRQIEAAGALADWLGIDPTRYV